MRIFTISQVINVYPCFIIFNASLVIEINFNLIITNCKHGATLSLHIFQPRVSEQQRISLSVSAAACLAEHIRSHPVFVNNLTVSCKLWSLTIIEHCYLLKRNIRFLVKYCNELTCDQKIRIYEQLRCIMFHSKVSISKWYTRTAIVDRRNCYTLAVSLIDNHW